MVVAMLLPLIRLRRLREGPALWRPLPEWYSDTANAIGVSARLHVSTEVEGAVTFGLRRPSILVPDTLLEAPDDHQRAVVAHELHHVARRDWVWMLAGEAAKDCGVVSSGHLVRAWRSSACAGGDKR